MPVTVLSCCSAWLAPKVVDIETGASRAVVEVSSASDTSVAGANPNAERPHLVTFSHRFPPLSDGSLDSSQRLGWRPRNDR